MEISFMTVSWEDIPLWVEILVFLLVLIMVIVHKLIGKYREAYQFKQGRYKIPEDVDRGTYAFRTDFGKFILSYYRKLFQIQPALAGKFRHISLKEIKKLQKKNREHSAKYVGVSENVEDIYYNCYSIDLVLYTSEVIHIFEVEQLNKSFGILKLLDPFKDLFLKWGWIEDAETCREEKVALIMEAFKAGNYLLEVVEDK